MSKYIVDIQGEIEGAYEIIEKYREPSNDCISRAEAIKGLGEEPYVWTGGECEIQEHYDWKQHKEMLEQLPSVTSASKTGHWIVHPKGIYANLVCDKCLSRAPYNCETNYCPNCGAKMESEG